MLADAFPRPEPGDPEELSWALQTAHNMWSQGDAREAVRWLQRAALTATEIGMHHRGQSIAQLATHLRDTTRSQPPGAPAAPTASQPAQQGAPSNPLARTHVSPAEPDVRPAAPPNVTPHPVPEPPGAPTAPRQALRVCFSRNHDGSLSVIPLAEGEPCRVGMAEALLVELQPGSLAR